MNNHEQELVRRAQKGDRAAFERLVQENALYVFNLAVRTLNDLHEAEDLAQEAFIRAWQALPGFRGEAGFRTWLYRIVTNLCYNRLLRLKKELDALGSEDFPELPDENRSPEKVLLDAETRNRLHEAMRRLPQSYRLLLNLRHLQGLSYDEIAQVTGQPLGTVKTGIFRARKKLKDELELIEANYG